MISASQNEFWNKAAEIKEFKDPFYLSQLEPYINTESFIIEYGCGYGRLLNILHENNFQNIIGFDFSQGMIDRGKREFPHLNIQMIDHASVPLQNELVDAVILSTVLTCVPDSSSQEQIIQEISRLLKPDGVIYLHDFLTTNTDYMLKNYLKGFSMYHEWGVYQNREGVIVRHYTQDYLATLLKNFTPHWYYEEDFVTMNNNPIRTFHGIYKKKYDY